MSLNKIQNIKQILRTRYNYQDGELVHKKGIHKGKPLYKCKYSNTKDSNGGYWYSAVKVKGVRYKQALHRLIWLWHYGNISKGLMVDHIDQDPGNNRVENLRLVTNRDNQLNRGIPKNNTSGYKGVSFRHKKNTYRVRITLPNGKVKETERKTLGEAIQTRKLWEEMFY